MHLNYVVTLAFTLALVTACSPSPDHHAESAASADFEEPTAIEISESKAIEIAQNWAVANLDLDEIPITDFHVDVTRFERRDAPDQLYVQFAHKEEMSSIIHDYGIEGVYGGFPYYFSITLSLDGKSVLEHYDSSM
ncbi:hypothetical protein Poly51_63290 [Rubripirellula tenax]|uniref:Uncharacterized protein n=1 Tax=Rubripirellula tenax TaxID=2528015 RepID=A0A5C6E8M1_9BACT|nr:hypothetical protein [Rubripirellula tenax]TWU43569.1 hypothetical protein Poly51_63290 [Rubripirellula tenax]